MNLKNKTKKNSLSFFIIIGTILLILVFLSSNDFRKVNAPFVLNGQEILSKGYKYSNTNDIFLSSLSEVNCVWKSPLEDDGYKVCEVIFQVEDKRSKSTIIENPQIYLDFLDSKNIRDIEILYSVDYALVPEVYKKAEYFEEPGKKNNLFNSFTGLVVSENLEEDVYSFRGVGREISNYRFFSEEKREFIEETIVRRNFENFFYFQDSEIALEKNLRVEENSNKIRLVGKAISFFNPNTIDTSKPFAVLVKFEIPKYEENSFNFEISDNNFEAIIDPEILGCGVLNSPNSIYYLNKSAGSSGTCFQIYANNVTLDCQGFTISFGTSADNSYGVYSNSSDTVIKNCILQKTEGETLGGAGVYLVNSAGALIEGNEFSLVGNYNYGVLGINLSNKANILGNGFTLSGNSSAAMRFENSLGPLLSNNEVLTYLNYTNGVSLINTNGAEIISNILTIEGDISDGVYLYSSSDTKIKENQISAKGISGNSINLKTSSDNEVYSNLLKVYGLYGAAYDSSDGSSGNSFYGNEISTFGIDRYGIFLSNDSANHIYENVIETEGDFGYGILIYKSNNNVFEDISIHTLGDDAVGIFFDYPSTGNEFSNIDILTEGSGASSVYVWYENHDFSFTDSVFNSTFPGEAEVYFDSLIEGQTPGKMDFINVDFDLDHWQPTANGELNVYWYLDVSANYTNAGKIPGAVVKGYDENWNLVFDTTTSSSSFIPRQTLKEYTKNNSLEIFYNRIYNINSSFITTFLGTQITLNKNTYVPFIYPIIYSSDSGGGRDSCDPLWVCTDWSECIGGKSTRTCVNEVPECNVGEPLTEEECIEEIIVKPKKVLFDINAKLLKQRIVPPSNLSAKISLLNVGDPGNVRANLTYSIMNEKGELVYFEEDSLTLQTQIEFMKTFKVDTYFEGRYDLYIDLDYEGQKEPASARERFFIGAGFYFSTINIILVILIIGVLSLIGYSLWKKKKEKEESDKGF